MMHLPTMATRREEKEAAARADEQQRHDIAALVARMPRRQPAWPEEVRQRVDRLALTYGKRMVLWDDASTGFYAWINWDWSNNIPAAKPSHSSVELGWYATLKQFLQAPLLDTTVNDQQLAQWIDEHTMTVHRFLPLLHRVRRTDALRKCPADGNDTATPAPMWELVEDEVA